MQRDLAIEPYEAEAVRKLFRMTTTEGSCSYQLAEYLNNAGYRTHGGAAFQSVNILRILKNEIYCGYLHNGDARSNRIESLQIIDDQEFALAQEILR